MNTRENEMLDKYTTLKIGGIAEKFYIPESEDELISLIKKIKDRYYILSGGSNLLINDSKKFKHVIDISKLDNKIIDRGNGKFYCGSSVRIQKFIKEINKEGYGGIEELISLPARVGGIIYMNAGIGGRKKPLFNISDYIDTVYVIYKGEKKTLKKDECMFEYRKSIFNNDEYIILGADFVFSKQNEELSKERIEKRLKKCKQIFDYSGGNCGTVFSKSNGKIMTILKWLGLRKGNVSYSRKRGNWIISGPNARYKDMIYLINICKILHRICLQSIELEIIIWE